MADLLGKKYVCIYIYVDISIPQSGNSYFHTAGTVKQLDKTRTLQKYWFCTSLHPRCTHPAQDWCAGGNASRKTKRHCTSPLLHPATLASYDHSDNVVTQQANREDCEQQNACEANKKLTHKPHQQCNKHMVVHILKIDNTAEGTEQNSITG